MALAAALSTSVFGALSAAPITDQIAPAPIQTPVAETSANVLFASMPAASMANAATPAPETAPETAAQTAPTRAPVQLADRHGHDGWFFGMFDDDDDDHHRRGRHHDDDDDDYRCPPGAANCAASPAAAGTTAPPDNGLFTPGAKPQVQTN
ncbi:hypothetical protein CKO11_12690 [Rhodobacter sp. TJ_12]|nr:hypothetical protein [Rhodobacter sp. TJ_12]